MNKNIIITFLIISFSVNSQTKREKSFAFEYQKIAYTRVDYTRYGLAESFITMFKDEPKNQQIVSNAVTCLKQVNGIYHRLYYFIKIPTEIKDFEKQQKIFTAFVEHIRSKEKKHKSDLYLNFDVDYSMEYQIKYSDKETLKRIYTKVDADNICKGLSIRKK